MIPFDAVVLAKLAISEKRSAPDELAQQLHVDIADITDSLGRLRHAGLYTAHGASLQRSMELFEHAVRYIAPPTLVEGVTSGIPTASNAPGLNHLFGPNALPWIWRTPSGQTVGRAILPLHPSVPEAVRHDDDLYLALSCIECFRVGRAREQNAAREVLSAMIFGALEESRAAIAR